jgi:serine phosphatase RsbU (regulator of sigma subunit)
MVNPPSDSPGAPAQRPAQVGTGQARRTSGPGRGSSGQIPGRTSGPGRSSALAPGHSSGRHRQTAKKQDSTGQQRQAAGKPGHEGFGRVTGLGLRAKFMLVLSGVTVVVLVTLGLSMANTTNTFLFSQKQHDGIEIARLAAQIGSVVKGKLDLLARLKQPLPSDQAVAQEIADALNRAKDWGRGNTQYSDILAVRFDCPQIEGISAAGIGELESTASIKQQFPSLRNLKGGGDIPMPAGMAVYECVKKTPQGEIPIYRFRIDLDSDFLTTRNVNNEMVRANVRVDIAADSVKRVSRNLLATIGIAVVIAIGVVIAVANWLASTITRPLDLLIHDMKVVARGNLDHETRTRSQDEIGLLANEFNRMTQNLKLAQVALVEQEKAEYELSIAREVQRQLLPAEAPVIPGYDPAAFYQGAKAVSGDYFDFIPLGNGLWGFIIADVSGKGIPGSMVMAVTRTIVRLVANRFQHRAADTLKETNRLIAKQIKRGMFVTACYAILDEATGVLTYASAGHNPMVIYRHATRSHELGTGKGIALGFNEGPVFDQSIKDQRTTLNAGDVMVIYTDGFPEAMNARNEEFGEERFYQTIARYGHLDARTFLAKVVEEVAAHRGAAEQSDDLTIIAVRNLASA